jgi:hypothetical protein
MAKTNLNSALKGISGGIDNWVYRSVGGRMVISRRPTGSRPATPGQLAVRERFRLATEYAKATAADPVLRALHEPIAKEKGVALFVLLMTDFLRPPIVNNVDLAGYQGRVGDLIRIRASDYAAVTAVSVAIRAEDLTVLEEGAAVLQFGTWVYTATTAQAPGVPVTITATAVDRPGNTATKMEAWG